MSTAPVDVGRSSVDLSSLLMLFLGARGEWSLLPVELPNRSSSMSAKHHQLSWSKKRAGDIIHAIEGLNNSTIIRIQVL